MVGEQLVPEAPSSASLAEAMLLQSKALSALVSQLAQSQDPLGVDLSAVAGSGLSTRGTLREAEDAIRAPPSGWLLRPAAQADRLETHNPLQPPRVPSQTS